MEGVGWCAPANVTVMDASKSVAVYVGVLLIVGLAMVLWGTFMPLGGGVAVLALGAAAVAAGLVLVGLRLAGPRS